MAITNYYVRATNGADVAGQGTTHATAYKTVQFALDDIGATHGRNAVDGDQINICDSSLEGANVLAAPLTLATYGAPTLAAPLVIRGYTVTANDGGRGAINANTNAVFVATYNYVHVVEIDFTGLPTAFGTTAVTLGSYCLVALCSFGNARNTLVMGTYATLAGSSFLGSGGAGVMARLDTGSLAYGNYFVTSNTDSIAALRLLGGGTAAFNIVKILYASTTGIEIFTGAGNVSHNIVYNAVAGTKNGIYLREGYCGAAYNNIVCGQSGAGGYGISYAAGTRMSASNAFWNNTANVNGSAFVDIGGDVALAADPFTDALNGDFSLTDAAKAALAAKGWPQSYLGAHANTVPNLNIGPIQMAAGGGGGGPVIGSRIIRGLGAL